MVNCCRASDVINDMPEGAERCWRALVYARDLLSLCEHYSESTLINAGD